MRCFNIFTVLLSITFVLSVHAAPRPGLFAGIRSLGEGVSDTFHVIANTGKNAIKNAGSVLGGFGEGVHDVARTFGNGVRLVSKDLESVFDKLFDKEVQEEAKNEVEKQIETLNLNISKEDQTKIYNACITLLNQGKLHGDALRDIKKLAEIVYKFLDGEIPLEVIETYLETMVGAIGKISVEVITETPK